MGLAESLFGFGGGAIVLYFLQPLINVFRVDLLASNPEGLVLNFILMLLIPIIWIIYITIAIIQIRRDIIRVDFDG